MFIAPGDLTTNTSPGPVPQSATDEANQLIKQYGSAAAALAALQKDPVGSLDQQDRQALAVLQQRVGATRTTSTKTARGTTAIELGPHDSDMTVAEEIKAFGPQFVSAFTFGTTQQYVDQYLETLDTNFPDTGPPPVMPWEVRIGLSKFIVPPININVHQQFATGNLGSGGLRQASTLKFSSGHSETVIDMTLYFPTADSIWGFTGGAEDIDFDNPADIPKINAFAASLRGLIAQFKYAPVLPIANAYLNSAHDITAVCLQNLSLATIEGFPFCIAANLTLLKFNHEISLPMVDDFNTALNYGRFRSYLGRAAKQLNQITDSQFLTTPISNSPATTSAAQTILENNSSATVAALEGGGVLSPDTIKAVGGEGSFLNTPGNSSYVNVNFDDSNNKVSFNKLNEIYDGRNLDFFFPDHDPAQVIGAVANLLPDPPPPSRAGNPFTSLLDELNLNPVLVTPDQNLADPNNVYKLAQSFAKAPSFSREMGLLHDWLSAQRLGLQTMGPDALGQWSKNLIHQLGPNPSPQAVQEITARAKLSWVVYMYNSVVQSPQFQAIFAAQALYRGQEIIDEWEVPMRRLGLDPNNVIVEGVVVNLSNRFARMQVQMQDSPAYQHIGADDTTCMISMKVLNTTNLVLLRRMFETIQGLGRMEHGHAVLGFLGIKNIFTALSGMKYALPTSFEVDTIPGFPGAYDVRITLVDFDVFQQKREQLNSEQQTSLVEAFGKRNPFLRIKQLWGAVNTYPDMPLGIRQGSGIDINPSTQDQNAVFDPNQLTDATQWAKGGTTPEGTVLACLDPDYYFYTYQPPSMDVMQADADSNIKFRPDDPNSPYSDTVNVQMGNLDEGNSHVIQVHGGGLNFIDGSKSNEPFLSNMQWNEPLAENILTSNKVPGCTPPAGHVQSYQDGGSNLFTQYEGMLGDWQYRDLTGRMIKAYPTYVLWLIDEGGNSFGVKLNDNFYGLQSVLDFSVLQSEDVMSDTLVLRLSNLYGRLTTNYADLVDAGIYGPENAYLINNLINTERNLASGLGNSVVSLQTVKLQPGARVHLRVGYSSNVNNLYTIFNGTITNVETGDILTITAQSDSMELSAIVNDTNPKASSGNIDGSMLGGFWMSEPRDLIVRLLTMGGSVFREAVAHATHGLIFSENKYGIRHFGSMLYDSPTGWESENLAQKRQWVEQKAASVVQPTMGSELAQDGRGALTSVGAMLPGMWDVAQQMWVNFTTRRDYEVFMRNIYPGNGTGIAQFMGGDLGDGGVALALAGTGYNPTTDPSSQNIFGLAAKPPDNETVYQVAAQLVDEQAQQDQGGTQQSVAGRVGHDLGTSAWAGAGFLVGGVPGAIAGAFVHGGGLHPLAQLMGLQREVSDEVPAGFAEVSFRVSTYQKSLWDIFVTCAALLPNYIIAVRPFEGRSTVFYGKPHWNYTSGLIPVTTGIDEKSPPPPVGPDAETQALIDKANQLKIQQQTPAAWAQSLGGVISVSGGDPNSTTAGAKWNGGDVQTLPLQDTASGATIPVRTGILAMEMHLDIQPHDQLSTLPPQYRYPGYKDHNTIFDLTPEAEQWFMNMRWFPDLSHVPHNYPQAWKGRKILVYCQRTKKGVVCTPGDYGPASFTGRMAGVSPDAYFALGAPSNNPKTGDPCWYGFVSDNTPLGPVDFSSTQTDTSGSPSFFSGNPSSYLPDIQNSSSLPAWMNNSRDLKQTQDPATYSFDFGWNTQGIPVDYTDPKTGLVDEAGEKALTIFQGFRSVDQALDIWDEFRGHFPTDSEVTDAYHQAFPDGNQRNFINLLDTFMRDMWQDPYARGWVVYTADAEVSWSPQSIESGAASGVTSGGEAAVGAGVRTFTGGWSLSDPLGNIGRVIAGTVEVAGGALVTAAGEAAGVATGGNGGGGTAWNFDRAHQAWEQFLQESKSAGGIGKPDVPGKDSMQTNYSQTFQWMLQHNQKGSETTSPINKAIEAGVHVFDKGVDFVAHIISEVGFVVSTVVNFLRQQLSNVMGGIQGADANSQQANLMNSVFNDSVYFDPQLIPGSLLYYCDNPFTREFGEPVVEIREPFQRFHKVDSFSHILTNGIQENMDGVVTNVTATSNGQNPVTVWFDKGAPSQFQISKSVDTGLFWDRPTSLLGWIFHPLSQIESLWRMYAKWNMGYSDETSAKRVALYHLRESLKDIYRGELITIGDASIRPHDLVYLADSYERMTGGFEVEQVVHHFTPETGFVTSITPNAVVSVNDPGRWSVMYQIHARSQADDVRTWLRQSYGKGGLQTTDSPVSLKDMASMLEGKLQGSLKYNGGPSHVLLGIGGAVATGSMVGGPLVGALTAFVGWKAWDWVKNNLLDQHGCDIWYLNKNGFPMEAGLTYNSGVAVGSMNTLSFMNNALFPFNLSTTGQTGPTINWQDLLAAVGWNKTAIKTTQKDINVYVNKTNARLLDITNRNNTGFANPNSIKGYLGVVVGFQAPDIIHIAPLTNPTWRPSTGYQPLPNFKGLGLKMANILPNDNATPGDLSYAKLVLMDNLLAQGCSQPTVGVMIDSNLGLDRQGRAQGFIFMNSNFTSDAGSREEELWRFANNPDLYRWDAYLPDGRAYTYNWQAILDGHVKVDRNSIDNSVNNQGVVLGGGSMVPVNG